MFFEWIDGLSWGWLIFAHVIALAIIYTPFIWDAMIGVIEPIMKMIVDNTKDADAK